jgi:hypothetical protein
VWDIRRPPVIGRQDGAIGSGTLLSRRDPHFQLDDIGGGILCGIFLPGDREVLIGCFETTVRLRRLPASLRKRSAQ